VDKLVEYEHSADKRDFFSYLQGRTRDVAILHKGKTVKVVPLEAIWHRLRDGWLLVDTKDNHRPEILHAAQTEPKARPLRDLSVAIDTTSRTAG